MPGSTGSGTQAVSGFSTVTGGLTIIMKRIILTGGGTAGHVTPNMALMPELKKHGYDIQYIGSYDGMEKKLIEDMGIPYHGIASGKLRRYFSMKNFSDPFKVLKGISEAKKLMKELKPDVVFSKGGFVTVPVVFAAHSAGIPVVIHESDMTPGLANKLALPKATKVCCNFPETKDLFPEGKAVVTGTPIREELFRGDSAFAYNYCGFTDNKPVLLIVGGSSGSVIINNAIRDNIDRLLETFNVIHLCGKDNLDESLKDKKGYVQYEYVKKELASMLALCDIIISRAGANAICELLALRKPNILIPLSKAASRGKGCSKFNGDNFLISRLDCGKTTAAIADGMGSGKRAFIESRMVIELMENCIDAGFDEHAALDLINAAYIAGGSKSVNPVTMDMSVIDCNTGIMSCIKMGAAATFIKRDSSVEVIKSTTLPLGVLEKVDYERVNKKLYNGDYVIMVSDGLLDNIPNVDKEKIFADIINTISVKKPDAMAEEIMRKSLKYNGGKPSDDMTVLVLGLFDTYDK